MPLSLFCLAASVQLAADVLLARSTVGSALRGARPSHASLIVIFAVRVPAILLLVGTASTAVVSGTRLQMFSADGSIREAARDAVTVTVGGITSGPFERTWPPVERFVRKAEAAGQAVLTSPQELHTLTDQPTGVRSAVLVVNDAYLQMQPVFEQGGARVRASESLQVLVPPHLHAQRNVITTTVQDWVAFLLEGAQSTPHASTHALAAGQRLYTYATPERVGRTWMDEPVVVVIPTLAGPRMDDMLASWVTTGDIVFADPGWVNATIDHDGLQDILIAVSPVSQAAADEQRRLASNLRMAIIDVIVAFGALALVSIASIAVFARRFAARSFLRHTAGWSMIRSNLRAFAIEVAFASAAVAATIQNYEARRPDPAGWRSALDPAAASSADALMLTLVLVGCVLLVNLAAIVRTGARLIRMQGKDG